MNQLTKLLILAITICGAELYSSSIAKSSTEYQQRLSHLSKSTTKLNQRRAKVYNLSNISIGGIKPGMTLKQITNILGKPRKSDRRYQGCDGEYLNTLSYDRLEIELISNRISIRTSNPAYKTDKGIKVGDSIQKAKQYARILAPSLAQNPKILRYAEAKKPGVLTYTEEDNTTQSRTLSFGYANGLITYIEYYQLYHEDC